MPWAAKQLLRDADRRDVWVVPNAEHRASRSFDDPEHGTYVPRWGSLALLRVAVQAQAVGLHAIDVILRDVAGMPLEQVLIETCVEDVLAAVHAGDLDSAQTALLADRGPYTVEAVELRSSEGARVVVSRYGGFDETNEEPERALLAAAKSLLHIS